MLKLSRLPSGEPEIFASIQGEGVSCGTPSVFVRLALCNLRCAWCDTAYTWDWKRYDQARETLAVACGEVLRRVLEKAGGAEALTDASEAADGQCIRTVVVTGGEPLIQQRELAPLLTALKAAGMSIEIETNGTLIPADVANLVDQWNVSPKLANSGNDLAAREVAPALAWFAAAPSAFFKFVVADPTDLAEVRALVARYRVPRERVLLMPEAADAETLAARSPWVIEQCQLTGYRFGPRLHVALWGATRGR
jgi:organic radical activating enzyme